MSIPPAWHPDPTSRHDHRWWDGTQWTEHVADGGVAAVDPLEAGGASDSGAATRPNGPEATGGGPDDATAAGATDSGWSQTTEPDASGSEGATGAAGSGSTWPSPQGSHGSGSDASGGAWAAGTPAGASFGSGGEAPGGGWPTSGEGQASGWGGATAAQPPNDGLAISALIVGLVSLGSVVFILGAIFLFGGIGGIVAVVLGAVGLSRIKKSGRRGRGMAITGLVTGILAIVGTAVLWVVFLAAGPAWLEFMGDFADEYQECLEEVGDEEYCQQLLEDEIEQEFFGG